MLILTLKKEWLESKREGRSLWLGGIILLLLMCALFSGWHNYQQLQNQKHQVSQSERDRWLNQGEKGPHAAAHYGVYIIKPDSALAVLDPGLSDYLGAVQRLEAHKKNDTLFRPIQDGIQMQRFGSLNPAFIVQMLLPLLIILLGFHSIAAERESGTLKQLLACGIKVRRFFYCQGTGFIWLRVAVFYPSAFTPYYFPAVTGNLGVRAQPIVQPKLLHVYFHLGTANCDCFQPCS